MDGRPGIGFENLQMDEFGQPQQNRNGQPQIGFEGLSDPAPPPASGTLYPSIPSNGPPAVESNDIDVDQKEPLTDAKNESAVDVESIGSKDNSRGCETLYFNDGVRRIDYVLAYEDDSGSSEKDEKKRAKREYYERELEDIGLELETEPRENSQKKNMCYTKIHLPWEVALMQAELLKIKMPIYEGENDIEDEGGFFSWIKMPNPFEISEEIIKPDPNYFTAPFTRERQETFKIDSEETFFTPAQRSRMVYDILTRTEYEDCPEGKKQSKIGFKRLVNQGVFKAVYPLHEGPWSSGHSLLTYGADNDRHLLFEEWAKLNKLLKYQPLDLIRKYFGEKVGIYFNWLGFYTQMLIPASLVGFICFLYGCATIFDNPPSEEICDDKSIKNLTMCPLCDIRCPYWKLGTSCLFARVTYVFDNPSTVFFAIFMALWACVFLELWKRRQAFLEYDWDIADFEDEEEIMRPEYEVTAPGSRKNPITGDDEPYMPLYCSIPREMSALVTVLFMVCLVVAAVFGIIVYRIVVFGLFSATNDPYVQQYAKIGTTVTASLISLTIIMLLNFVYTKLAVILTDFENPKTQTDYDDKLTLKMYCFQFVNYYSTLIYIAFFKGRFTGRPGAYETSLTGKRPEECDPAGCLFELFVQLAIIMVGKQIMNNCKELLIPFIKNYIAKKRNASDENHKLPRWEADFNLAQMPPMGLFDEYLEMVIQYGFVTIFVAAFPLAPLFALLNNFFEIRLDAFKFCTQWQRPMAARAQDIGIWFSILNFITKFSILSNGFIIAFTSEFVPKLVYKIMYSPDGSLSGYIQDSLSLFDTADFKNSSRPDPKWNKLGEVDQCWYRDRRAPPGAPNEYQHTLTYWHVLAGRIFFVLVFENVIVILTYIIQVMVPDVPKKVKDQIQREKFLAKQAVLQHETDKRRKKKED